MNNWNMESILDQSGKIIIITGANSGLGFEMSRILAHKGAKVIMACRNPVKGEDALKAIQAENPRGNVRLMLLDLADLVAVRSFTHAFMAEYDHLDLLINNAAALNTPVDKTKDGHEIMLGVNHLGHFALTGLLFKKLEAAPEGRVVAVSSLMHKQGILDLDDLPYENGYTISKGYARSKLANLLHVKELSRRISEAGGKVIAAAAHPGYTYTDQAGDAPPNQKLMQSFTQFVEPLFAMHVSWGALPILYAGLAEGVKGNDYYGPDGFAELWGRSVAPAKRSAASQDEELARKLWEVSETLTDITYL